MRKKIPVLISILLISLWLLAIIAGCSGSDNGGGSGESSPTPTSSPTTGWVVNVTGVNSRLNDSSFISQLNGWVVGNNGSIIKTEDSGTNWSSLDSGVTVNLYGLFFLNSNEGIAVGAEGTVIRTVDGGATWNEAVTISPETDVDLYGVKFQESTGWIVGANGTLYKSTDRGVSWVTLNSGVTSNLNDLSFIDSETGWICGDNGVILKTSDGGSNWTAQVSGITSNLNGISFVNSISGWAVGDGGVILATNDGGTTWGQEQSGVSTNLADIHFVDVSYGWAVGENGLILHKGIAQGKSKLWAVRADWYRQTSNTTADLIKLIFINRNIGYIVGENGLILITTNGGDDPGTTPTPTTTTTPTSTPTDTPTTTPTSTITPDDPNPPQNKTWQGPVAIDGQEVPKVNSSKKLDIKDLIKEDGNLEVEQFVDITAFADNTAIAVFTRAAGEQPVPQSVKQDLPFFFNIYASRYDGTQWLEPIRIDADVIQEDMESKQIPAQSLRPRIAKGPNGKAMAVWIQSDGFYRRAYANYWDGSAWGSAQLIDVSSSGPGDERDVSAGNVDRVEIAYASNGEAIAVFSQYIDEVKHIYANHWDGEQWTGTVAVDSIELSRNNRTIVPSPSPSISPTPSPTPSSSHDSKEPQIAMLPNGNAFAVFVTNTGSRYAVALNFFDGESWSYPMQFDNHSGGDSSKPQVTLHGNLQVNIVFNQYEEGRKVNLKRTYASYIDMPNETIKGPVAIDSSNAVECNYPCLAVSYLGQSLAVFEQYADGAYKGASNASYGGVYSVAQFFDTVAYRVIFPRAAFDLSTSEAVVTYTRFEGEEGKAEGYPLAYANTWYQGKWKTSEFIGVVDFPSFGTDIAWGNRQAFAIFAVPEGPLLRIYVNHYK